MGKRRIGGGFIFGSSVLAPIIQQAADIHIPQTLGYPLLGLCAIAAIIGLVMVILPEPNAASASAPPRQSGPHSRHWKIEVSGEILFAMMIIVVVIAFAYMTTH